MWKAGDFRACFFLAREGKLFRREHDFPWLINKRELKTVNNTFHTDKTNLRLENIICFQMMKGKKKFV